MGTRVDYMGRAAHIDIEPSLVKRHVMSRQTVNNRMLLRRVMRAAGFKPLRTEWWHFNYKSRAQAKRHYKVIQ
jgi:D-alanyl-D-alanine dipeptidase